MRTILRDFLPEGCERVLDVNIEEVIESADDADDTVSDMLIRTLFCFIIGRRVIADIRVQQTDDDDDEEGLEIFTITKEQIITEMKWGLLYDEIIKHCFNKNIEISHTSSEFLKRVSQGVFSHTQLQSLLEILETMLEEDNLCTHMMKSFKLCLLQNNAYYRSRFLYLIMIL